MHFACMHICVSPVRRYTLLQESTECLQLGGSNCSRQNDANVTACILYIHCISTTDAAIDSGTSVQVMRLSSSRRSGRRGWTSSPRMRLVPEQKQIRGRRRSVNRNRKRKSNADERPRPAVEPGRRTRREKSCA